LGDVALKISFDFFLANANPRDTLIVQVAWLSFFAHIWFAKNKKQLPKQQKQSPF
jgi:hypothetical protein